MFGWGQLLSLEVDSVLNLLIAFTPTHFLTCTQIIRELSLKEPRIVYFGRPINLESLNACDAPVIFCENAINWLKLSRYLLRFRGKWESIYCSNYKIINTRMTVMLSSPSCYFSFDDGVGHISGSGYFYDLEESTRLHKFLFGVFSHYQYKNIIRRIERHFTYFKHQNWCEFHGIQKLQIDIFSSLSKKVDNKRKKMVNILVGSVLKDDFGLQAEEILEIELIEKLSIDYYIPHPRRATDSFSSIEQNMLMDGIAEVILSQLKAKYTQLTVYGFSSTVLVNIADVDGFRCVNLELSDGLPVLKKYESFFRELGVDSQRVEIEHLT